MAIKYACNVCGRGEAEGVTRDKLLVKKVRFETMGSGSKVLRTRVVGWLCFDCVVKDSVWTMESKQGQAPRTEGEILG